MALLKINRIKKMRKDSNRIHKVVDASFTSFEKHGVKYYQIDTYGSDDRQVKGKVSQSIQMTEETIRELMIAMGIKDGN